MTVAIDAARDRVADLDRILRELEKRFGKQVVYRLTCARPKFGEHAVSTGSLGLDLATGRGGIPRGRMTTIDGPESSGKTTIGYHVLTAAQAGGGLAALIDIESGSDSGELRACGVDLPDLIFGQPNEPGEALAVTELLIRSSALDAIVVTVRPSQVAGRAEAARRLNAALSGTPTACVVVGSVGGRELPGRAVQSPFADFSSLRIRVSPIGFVRRSGGEVTGMRVRAEVVKNRLSSSGSTAEFDIVEGRGVDRSTELFDLGKEAGFLIETGFGWTYEGTLLGRSRDRAAATLEGSAALSGRLRAAILA